MPKDRDRKTILDAPMQEKENEKMETQQVSSSYCLPCPDPASQTTEGTRTGGSTATSAAECFCRPDFYFSPEVMVPGLDRTVVYVGEGQVSRSGKEWEGKALRRSDCAPTGDKEVGKECRECREELRRDLASERQAENKTLECELVLADGAGRRGCECGIYSMVALPARCVPCPEGILPRDRQGPIGAACTSVSLPQAGVQ